MFHPFPILITGAAGNSGAVGPIVVESLLERGFKVRAMVRREDERSEVLRAKGAELIVGDLLDLYAVHRAMEGVKRVYFSMSVAPTYLEATTNVAAIAKHRGVEAFVNMSQMTVSQMSIHETTDSPQQKQHWLAETVLRWSSLPVITLRPTAFLDVLFLQFATTTVANHNALMLPFALGKTSPIAAVDVARCVTEVLANPDGRIGEVYELTGPRSQDMNAIALEFSKALGRTISYVDVPPGPWEDRLRAIGDGAISPHLFAHLKTMAELNRLGRYDRSTDDVERLTAQRPMSVEQFVRMHRDEFLPASGAARP